MCTPHPTPLPNLTRIVGALRTMNNLCQYIMHLLSCINYLGILITNRVINNTHIGTILFSLVATLLYFQN